MLDPLRAAAAERARVAHDITMPRLQYWNYDPCPSHEMWIDPETGSEVWDRPKPECRQCGVVPRRHQRVGSVWLYLVMKGLLADTVGSGKTFHAAMLLALMKERGELSDDHRALIVVRPGALLQWRRQLQRVIPRIFVGSALGTPSQRAEEYMTPWDVMLIGYQVLIKDLDRLASNFDINTIIVDDVDALRHSETQTSYCVNRIARDCDRAVVMTATPLQKRLEDIHSVTLPVGSMEVFGSSLAFANRYVRREPQAIWVWRGRKKKKIVTNKIVGYKNIDEFKTKLAPLVLRRTASDIEDVDLPAIVSNTVVLDMYPPQAAAYAALKRDTRTMVRSPEFRALPQIQQRTQTKSKIHEGSRICAGLAATDPDIVDIPEGQPGANSVKYDWIMNRFGPDGDLEGDKAVIFIVYKPSIRVLQQRFNAAGFGYETIWGDEQDKRVRQQSIDRFWEDPRCRFLIGTTSIEQSLDLQVARHLVNVDMISNPARMEQLAGRIRRDGSRFRHVYVHNLICSDTHEERQLPSLEREQAVIDAVWDETSELFDALNPIALAQLITG